LTTQQPIFVDGTPELFIQIVSPTTQLYSEIQEAISLEQAKMFSLLVGTIAAITAFVVFLVKWNSAIENEARKRHNNYMNQNGEQENWKVHMMR
jgi:hypothetical protein